jgi:hypothetical protein
MPATSAHPHSGVLTAWGHAAIFLAVSSHDNLFNISIEKLKATIVLKLLNNWKLWG